MKRPSAMRSILFGELVVSVLMLCLLVRGRIESATTDYGPRVAPGGVPVLAYHYLRESKAAERIARSIGTVLLNLPLISSSDYWTVSSATFERHLRYLKEHGYRTISPETLIAYMRGEKKLEGRCAVITFDDGDESVYRLAYPLLKKYGMEGTVFVITAHVGRSWNGIELSSWSHLQEMKESGAMEIGSHTHDLHYKVQKAETAHPYFAVIGKGASRDEMEHVLEDFRCSRLAIERNTGEVSVCLAWPFGFGSDLADSLAGVAGYAGAMTLRPGLNRPGDSPCHIKRLTITAQTSFRSFETMVSGRQQIEQSLQSKENN